MIGLRPAKIGVRYVCRGTGPRPKDQEASVVISTNLSLGDEPNRAGQIDAAMRPLGMFAEQVIDRPYGGSAPAPVLYEPRRC